MKALLSLFILAIGMNVQAQSYDVKESVMGYIPRPSELFFQVRSGGCTSKEDFRFEVENAGGMKKVTLYRIRPDECYAFVPFGKVISFSYQELGLHSGDHFYVGNMIQTARVM